MLWDSLLLALVHEGQLVALHPVNLAANANAARAGRDKAPNASVEPLPPSAADLAYQRDFGPVVGPDGGFTDDQE